MDPPSLADDIRQILAYLELEVGSPETQRIVGLNGEDLSRLLRGDVTPVLSGGSHIRVVASIVRILAETRSAATGTSSRGRPATRWLNDARIQTRSGILSPLEILADEALAQEVLDGLLR